MKKEFVVAFLALGLASLACGININLPEAPEPGPLVIDQISVDPPASGEARLELSFGAGELKLSPGTKDKLVEGTATYNYERFKPVIDVEDSRVKIGLDQEDFASIPHLRELRNEWDFKLGNKPMELAIRAGAYEASYEFGGLSLTDLSIKDGAADVELSFSKPNPDEMTLFHYESGASNIKMEGLSNANFNAMSFEAGAGDYTLDFSGDLQRDAAVTIETGFANLILVIPDGLNTTVTVQSGVSNVNAGPGWDQNGNLYTKDGEGAELTIVIEMWAGNLTLSR